MQAFAQFVSRYVSTFGRWNSPKFLFGESYGTPRTPCSSTTCRSKASASTASCCSRPFSISILDWDVNYTPIAIGGSDWAFPLYLPTEAAASWYHHALPGPQTTLANLLPQVERFAMGEYLNALAQGASLSPSTYNDVVAKLHQYTGLSPDYIRQSNLRIPYWRYLTELLRNSGQTMGRLDARFTSYSLDRVFDRPQFDATDSAIDAAFVGAGNYYIRQMLRYNTTQQYLPLVIPVNQSWDWKHGGNLPTNTAQDLAEAMTFNPGLRVFSANGYYDMATPFFATVYTLNHLNLAPPLAEEHHVRLLRLRTHGLSASAGARAVSRRPRTLVRRRPASLTLGDDAAAFDRSRDCYMRGRRARDGACDVYHRSRPLLCDAGWREKQPHAVRSRRASVPDVGHTDRGHCVTAVAAPLRRPARARQSSRHLRLPSLRGRRPRR